MATPAGIIASAVGEGSAGERAPGHSVVDWELTDPALTPVTARNPTASRTTASVKKSVSASRAPGDHSRMRHNLPRQNSCGCNTPD
jgi:hypothetical protein